MKYFIQFSYFGKNYHGWQKQPNAITVQQVLEKALSTLLRTTVETIGAGRTDTGVHAKQMIAHFDAEPINDLSHLTYRLNSLLPFDVAVSSIREVTNDAHARFNATARTYQYVIIQEKNPFYTEQAYFVKYPIDIKAMNKAANMLLQYTDFECFSKLHTDVKTFNCKITQAQWIIDNDFLVFTITADRFLRNMVRAIVGTLLDIGQHKINIDDLKAILNSKDRAQAGVSVPAKGLYLTAIKYPRSIFEHYE